MTISEIVGESAKRAWFDTKARKTKTELIPVNVLKKFIEPPPIEIEGILNALRR